MADQVYDLTQTGSQVQAIVNDANKVMGAGSQSTLTTDSILLKDTSGNYHKIDKSSFTEAVRNTLASLLVNNDKGTTISQIAAIASGDFGSVTPANLASVLGVPAQTQYSNNPPNVNTFTTTGFYKSMGSENSPVDATTVTYLVIGYDTFVWQLATRYSGTQVWSRVGTRTVSGGDFSWSTWKEL